MTALFDQHGLTLSSPTFYYNNPHPYPPERKNISAHVQALIDAAALLSTNHGHLCRTGPTKSVADNLRDAEQVFRRLVDRAGERG